MMLYFAWRQPRAAVLSDLTQRRCTVYPAVNKGRTASGAGLSMLQRARFPTEVQQYLLKSHSIFSAAELKNGV